MRMPHRETFHHILLLKLPLPKHQEHHPIVKGNDALHTGMLLHSHMQLESAALKPHHMTCVGPHPYSGGGGAKRHSGDRNRRNMGNILL